MLNAVGATYVALSIGAMLVQNHDRSLRQGKSGGGQREEQGNGTPQTPMEMNLGNNPDKHDTFPWNSNLEVGAGVSFQNGGRVHSSGKMEMRNMAL